MSARHRLPSGHWRMPTVTRVSCSSASMEAARRELLAPVRELSPEQMLAERARLHAEGSRDAQPQLPLGAPAE